MHAQIIVFLLLKETKYVCFLLKCQFAYGTSFTLHLQPGVHKFLKGKQLKSNVLHQKKNNEMQENGHTSCQETNRLFVVS